MHKTLNQPHSSYSYYVTCASLGLYTTLNCKWKYDDKRYKIIKIDVLYILLTAHRTALIRHWMCLLLVGNLLEKLQISVLIDRKVCSKLGSVLFTS